MTPMGRALTEKQDLNGRLSVNARWEAFLLTFFKKKKKYKWLGPNVSSDLITVFMPCQLSSHYLLATVNIQIEDKLHCMQH